MNNLFRLTTIAGLALIITGCAQYSPYCDPCEPRARTYVQVQQPPAQPAPQASYASPKVDDTLVIKVTGYGAPKSTFESLAQRRLMALRASELDAYRKIAEQVSGLHIVGDTRMDDFIADRDRLRAYLNSFVQGAAIINQEFEADGLAVTTMSLKISRSRMLQQLEQERRWHAAGGHLPPGSAYSTPSFAPRY
ncbi:LPP20 family lipoprotein [Marinobacterium sediminicola]|uniref:LPP20 lipoprotein n=1 Tax=Marinobacterium sediminicola TaxID=518898 RepID=A0ABY1S070_9GAMM|nr:hypothetical protein [Marinobacterium sediminicola]ULG69680.1 hypothetical protein LN244_02340 [Marinobacterium sediminicola]SMR74592.1 LPP20 lipoprotein [Marinobacterium sediminicola]